MDLKFSFVVQKVHDLPRGVVGRTQTVGRDVVVREARARGLSADGIGGSGRTATSG